MHFLYIIYSETLRRYYVGETPNVEIRLTQHTQHHFRTNFTKVAHDWRLSMRYECQTRSEAIFLEKFIKKMKSRIFIEKIIADPEILSDILKKRCP